MGGPPNFVHDEGGWVMTVLCKEDGWATSVICTGKLKLMDAPLISSVKVFSLNRDLVA